MNKLIMDLQNFGIDQLEMFIAEQQKKILVTHQLLKEDNLPETEVRRLNEELVRLKNQMFQYQTVLRKKYTEEFRKTQVNTGKA